MLHTSIVPFSPLSCVTFNSDELSAIFAVYSRKVACGEWRDYAIAFQKEIAVFAVFRRTADSPLFCIEKAPKLHNKQGAYRLISASGQTLKRGHDLRRVLMALEKPKLIS